MTLSRALLQSAVEELPPSVRLAALEDDEFAKAAGYRNTRTITFENLPFEIPTLSQALRRLFSKRSPITHTTATGQNVQFELDAKFGHAICVVGDKTFALPQLSMFAADPATREQALSNIPEFGALLPKERAKWRSDLAQKPLTPSGFVRLIDDLQRTPIAYHMHLSKTRARSIRLDEFVPSDAETMARTVGSVARRDTKFKDELIARQQDWIDAGSPRLLGLVFATVARIDMAPVVPGDLSESKLLSERVAAILPSLDPFARVAAIEFLTVAAHRLPPLEALAAEAVASHQARLESLTHDLKIFAGSFLLAQAQLSVEAGQTASWRHRRNYAWTLAGLACRGLAGQIKADDFFRWAFDELGHRYRIAVALDKQHAPRWSWSDGDPSQLRNEVFGRLKILCGHHPETAARIGLTDSLEAELKKADEKGSLPFWFMPAALEAEPAVKGAANRMTASIERHARERLALEEPAEAFIGVCNIAKLRTPRQITLAATIDRLQTVSKEECIDAKGNLQHFIPGLIHVACVTRSTVLADRVMKLLTELASNADASLMNSIAHNTLEGSSVVAKGRAAEDVFTHHIRRVISACTNGEAAVQIHHLLKETLIQRPDWRATLSPLIAAAELAT